MFIKILGLIIIFASFVYILIHHNDSLMDRLMKKRNLSWSDHAEEKEKLMSKEKTDD